ncbi:DUF2505 domain-containing protein [Nocardioidaceae bacterium]|nr:DUF2505 domain-containing protein [Nocardioidaceae bacterium]
MRYEHTMTYEASAEQVFEMLKSEEFREKVCSELRQTQSWDVDVTPKGEGMDVRIEQVQETKGVPSAAKKFIGDTTTIVQTEHWTSPRAADLGVEIPGKPGSVKGTISLDEHNGTTTETVSVDIKVSVPLIGGKLEKLIADLLSAAMRTEEKVGKQWLA